MITTDKLTEPAITVVEKPPANVIHKMPPPPARPQPVSLFTAANAAAPQSSVQALNALAFAGRFQGMPETEKFEVAAVPASAAEASPSETKPAKPVAQKSVTKKQVKEAKRKSKRQVARVNDKQKSGAAVTSRTESAASGFGSTPNGFPGGGPFGALFGSRPNQ